MKKLFLVIMSFVSGSALAAQDWHETCYLDINMCMLSVASNSGSIETIALTHENFRRFSPQIIEDFTSAGIKVSSLPPELYDAFKGLVKVTETKNVKDDGAIFADIPDEAWAVAGSSAACVGGVVTCSAASLIAVETFGVGYFAAKFWCIASVYPCLDMVRSFEKWKRYQLQLKKEDDAAKEAAKEAANAGGGGGGGLDDLGASSNGGHTSSEPTTGGGGSWHCVDTVVTVAGDPNPREETICGASN